jgi:hypothetical protein
MQTTPHEPHIGAALVHRQPAGLDCEIETCATLLGVALELTQKRSVDQLDMYPAVLLRLDGIGDVDQLAGGDFGVGVGAFGGEFRLGLH